MTIHLEHPLPDASCNQPGRQAGKALAGNPPRHPYSVLLPVGFAVPLLLPGARCALAAPFHPCRGNSQAVCSLWHYPWGHPRRTLSGTVFPWSPDFPPPQPFGMCGSGHPANWQERVRHMDHSRQCQDPRTPQFRSRLQLQHHMAQTKY